MSEAKKSTGGSKEHNFLSEYGYSTGCPNLMGRRLQYSSPRHMSQNSRGIFCPLNVGFCKFSCQTQKHLHGGGGGGAKRFVRNMGTARGAPAKCDEDCR